MGLTLQQLQQEGATPNYASQSTSGGQKLTLADLQSEGAQAGNSPNPNSQNVFQRVGSSLKNSYQNTVNDFSGAGPAEGHGLPSRITGGIHDITNAPFQALGAALPQPIRQGLSDVNQAGNSAINYAADKITDIPGVSNYVYNHPKFSNALEESARTQGNLAGIGSDLLGYYGAAKSLGGVKNYLTSSQAAPGITKTLTESLNYDPDVADAISNTLNNTGNAAQYVASGNTKAALSILNNAAQQAQGTALFSDIQSAAHAVEDLANVPFNPTGVSSMATAGGNAAKGLMGAATAPFRHPITTGIGALAAYEGFKPGGLIGRYIGGK